MIGWDNSGTHYTGLYRDPAEGERNFEIAASKESWDFTVYCPFDDRATTQNAKDIPSKPKLGIKCSKCGRFFLFKFPMALAVGALNLRDIPTPRRNAFKALCAEQGITMSEAVDAFMLAALSGAIDIRSLMEGRGSK
jgi:hypothetical protein